jgi:hypothetical protein
MFRLLSIFRGLRPVVFQNDGEGVYITVILLAVHFLTTSKIWNVDLSGCIQTVKSIHKHIDNWLSLECLSSALNCACPILRCWYGISRRSAFDIRYVPDGRLLHKLASPYLWVWFLREGVIGTDESDIGRAQSWTGACCRFADEKAGREFYIST